ncbi:MAG: PAS domain S-box protein, partial [Acidobacteriaceae bacterium]
MTPRRPTSKTPVSSSKRAKGAAPATVAAAPATDADPALLRALLDQVEDAIVLLGSGGQVEFANHAAQQRYSIRPGGPPVSAWSQAYGFFQADRQTPWPDEQQPGALALHGETVDVEQYLRSSSVGEGHWIGVRARPLRDPDGGIRGAILSWRDISAEKQTAESQRRLLAIVENTPDSVTLTDAALHTIFINRAGRELLGLGDQDDIRNFAVFPAGADQQRDLFDTEILPVLLRGEPWFGEFRLRHARSRQPVTVDMRAFGVFGTYGQLIGIAAVSRDITARRTAEQNRQRLAAIVENSLDAIISESLDGIITTWNRAAQDTFGYAAEEVIGRPITLLVWPGYEDDMQELLRRIRAEEVVEHYETLRRHKNGSRMVVSLTLSPVRDETGKLVGISKIARDITRQREQDDLSRRQAQLLDQAYEPILVRDHQDRIVYWNKGAERFYGWPAAEAIGRLSHELLQSTLPEPLEDINQRMEREGHWEGELLHRTRSGQGVMVLSRWIRELGVAESHVLETNVDMSERQQRLAAEEQSRMERRFRQLLEAAPDAIVEVSADGRIVLVNQIAEEMFGYRREELLGQSVDLLVPDAIRHQHHHYRDSYLDQPRTRPMGSGLDLHARRRDGSLFPVEISLSPIHTDTGVHVTAVIRD